MGATKTLQLICPLSVKEAKIKKVLISCEVSERGFQMQALIKIRFYSSEKPKCVVDFDFIITCQQNLSQLCGEA